MQIGDRLVFVRTLDGQTLVGKIHSSEWQDDAETGSFTLHWPMVYGEQEVEKNGQQGLAFGFLPPAEVFPVPSLEVRFAQRAILSDEAAKRLIGLYEKAVGRERQKDSGLITPGLAAGAMH